MDTTQRTVQWRGEPIAAHRYVVPVVREILDPARTSLARRARAAAVRAGCDTARGQAPVVDPADAV